jgi:hypothetical protein
VNVHSFRQYYGMYQLSVTETELVAIRDGYVRGTLATFAKNPNSLKRRVWIKPVEAEALTEYRVARGLRAPVLRGGRATAAQRQRVNASYRPRLRRN